MTNTALCPDCLSPSLATLLNGRWRCHLCATEWENRTADRLTARVGNYLVRWRRIHDPEIEVSGVVMPAQRARRSEPIEFRSSRGGTYIRFDGDVPKTVRDFLRRQLVGQD